MERQILQSAISRFTKLLLPSYVLKISKLENRVARLESTDSTLIDRVARFIACEMIEGDYIEFGVYKGASFSQAYHAIYNAFRLRIEQVEGMGMPNQQRHRQAIWDSMRFIAMDSFQGLPELRGPDTHTSDFFVGQYSASRNDFEQNLRNAAVDMSKVRIVPGWFSETSNEETWKKLGVNKAAIVWVDSDLYTSAKEALSGITELIQDGTVIVFDDWFAFRSNPALGEQRAFREWLGGISGYQAIPYIQEGVWRNSFIMSKS